MSDFDERLEQLATRGAPRGSDAVIDAARRAVEDDDSALQGLDEPRPMGAALDDAAVIGMEPGRSRHRGRRFASVIAATGVAAMLLVGTLAFGAFLGSGGGSDSPEGAVRQLADAVSREDPVAAADVLAPEEIRSLSQTVDAAGRRAQELQLARSASAPLAGLDLSVDNLGLSSETLADGYVKVTVSSGTVSASTHADQFSPIMREALHDPNGNSSSADLASLAKRWNLPTFVMTIQRGGHWYVSAAYTTLEYIREANDLPPADFGSGLRATATLGADSPDAAVTTGLRALRQGDWQALIALAPPDEIPVYDYRDALTQLGRDTKPSFTIVSSQTSVVTSGDTAKVGLKASGTTDSGDWSIEGACFEPPLTVTPIPGETFTTPARGTWCEPVPLFVFPLFGLESDVAKASRITTVQKDGRWFISPVGTALDLVDQYVSHITQRQLYTALNVPQELPADATLTLGTPAPLGPAGSGASVFALVGHRGDTFLGAVSTPAGFEEGFPQVLVYGPDGNVVRSTFDLVDGKGLRLPTDGTYKIVVTPFREGQTLTVWAAADAPDAVKHPPQAGSFDGCEPTSGGGISCSSTSFSSSSSSSSGGAPVSPSGSSSEHCTTNAAGDVTTCRGTSSAVVGSSSSSSSSSSSTFNGPTPTTATSVPGG